MTFNLKIWTIWLSYNSVKRLLFSKSIKLIILKNWLSTRQYEQGPLRAINAQRANYHNRRTDICRGCSAPPERNILSAKIVENIHYSCVIPIITQITYQYNAPQIWILLNMYFRITMRQIVRKAFTEEYATP